MVKAVSSIDTNSIVYAAALKTLFYETIISSLNVPQLGLNPWTIGLVVIKALDSQSRGPVFKTTGWLQG